VLLDPDPETSKTSFWYLAREEGLPGFVFTFASVNPGEESGWIRMNEDNLDLETDKVYLLFQYFVGVRKKGPVYCQYPSGEEIWTTDKNVPTTSSGHRKAFINNILSPFNDPSRLTQLTMVKGITVAYNYYNPTDHALIQEIKFIGKKFFRKKVELGKMADWLGRTITQADLDAIKEKAIPLQLQRIA